MEGFSKKKAAADTWGQTSRKIFCCAPLLIPVMMFFVRSMPFLITFKHIYLRLSTKFDIDFNFFKILT